MISGTEGNQVAEGIQAVAFAVEGSQAVAFAAEGSPWVAAFAAAEGSP